jgi:short-subunit dehydrogenase
MNAMPSFQPLRVLVTGCSSGIGRAAAIELSRRGHAVMASARNPQSLDGLPCTDAIALDVTSDSSVREALQRVGEIDVLVNNAGLGLWGAVETVALEAAHRLFDTNLFGSMRMAQAVLPGMRARRRGLILQVSSAAGRITSPLVGYYSASKHALEAASEALRLEVAAFGVKVSCVELGAVTSSLGENRSNFDSPDYAPVTAHFRARLMKKRSEPTSAEDAAAAIADVIDDGGAKFRYEATADAAAMIAQRQGMSDAEWEASLLQGLSL